MITTKIALAASLGQQAFRIKNRGTISEEWWLRLSSSRMRWLKMYAVARARVWSDRACL